MSASFVSASSQRLTNTATPITGYPCAVGIWVYPTTTGATRDAWSIADNASTLNNFELGQNSTNVWRLTAADGTAGTSLLIGTVTANAWTFLLGRWITATNRRLAILNPDGSTTHGQNTTSRTPAGVDNMALGCRPSSVFANFWDGLLAEFWYTNTDIQADGAQLQDSLLRQLAYDGPFSVPHIAKDIVEYHSFRHDLSSDTFSNDEDFLGIPGLETLTNTNGVTLGPHPPLRYQGRYNWRNMMAFDLPIFAGMQVATTPDLFSWGVTARNRLMMVGHGR